MGGPASRLSVMGLQPKGFLENQALDQQANVSFLSLSRLPDRQRVRMTALDLERCQPWAMEVIARRRGGTTIRDPHKLAQKRCELQHHFIVSTNAGFPLYSI